MSSEWFLMRVDPHEGQLEWPQYQLPITPGQAALGAMTDNEVAMVLLARRAKNVDMDGFIRDAIAEGLWPTEVGKGA